MNDQNYRSPANTTLEYLIGLNRASILAGGTQTTFVYRPGATAPLAKNVFTDWNKLYALYQKFSGPKLIQIDDSIVSPAVIPAGTYDLFNCTIVGNISQIASQNQTICHLADGVVFENLGSVTDNLSIVSLSTSVPAITLGGSALFIIQRGSGLTNAPGATTPLIKIADGQTAILVTYLGGIIGTTGNHCVDIGVGSTLLVVMFALGNIANDVLTGDSAQILVCDQSVFLNTPYPILQPAVTSLAVQVLQFANFVSFTALDNSNWAGPPPTNVEDATNRMASLVKTLNGGTPIP